MDGSSNTFGYELILDAEFFLCRKKVGDQISLRQ